MYRTMIGLILLAVVGCSGREGPVQSHGKPVAYWIELKSSDPKARMTAVKALGHAGKADPAALPAVIEALRDRTVSVRAAAALVLLQVGPDAADAVPALTELRQDKDPQVRSYAARALERIQTGK
jgi:HEAT repeat protein